MMCLVENSHSIMSILAGGMLMKLCPKCGEREKLASQSYCRPCFNAYVNARNAANREKVNKQARDRRAGRPEHYLEYKRRWNDAHREEIRQYHEQYYEQNPVKLIARRVRKTTQRMIHTGEIQISYRCAYCGTTENVVVHHLDYRDPKHIMPLCKEHHRLWHRMEDVNHAV